MRTFIGPTRREPGSQVPTLAGFAVGDAVTVGTRGHRHSGRAGTVSYLGTVFGTIGVSIDGQDYGFLPSELTPVSSLASDPAPTETRTP